jgi:hypothetical protein
MQALWGFIFDVHNQKTLAFLGAGAAAIATGIWAVVKHFFPSESKKKTGSLSINQSGTGFASGGDTFISAPVQFGLNEEKTGHEIKSAIQPFGQKIDEILVAISLDKGVPIAPLQAILLKVGGNKVSEQDLAPFFDRMADELLHLRKQLALVAASPGYPAVVATEAQAALDRGDLPHVNKALEWYWNSHNNPAYNDEFRKGMEEWTTEEVTQDQSKSIEEQLREWMEHASSTYEAKLNQKMKEWGAQPKNDLGVDSESPRSKVQLDQEVQTLIAQWKTITDMTSDLSKDINDMAMTPVRNLR